MKEQAIHRNWKSESILFLRYYINIQPLPVVDLPTQKMQWTGCLRSLHLQRQCWNRGAFRYADTTATGREEKAKSTGKGKIKWLPNLKNSLNTNQHWIQLQVQKGKRRQQVLQVRTGILIWRVSIHCSKYSWSLQQHGYLFFRVQNQVQNSAWKSLCINVIHGSNLKLCLS